MGSGEQPLAGLSAVNMSSTSGGRQWPVGRTGKSRPLPQRGPAPQLRTEDCVCVCLCSFLQLFVTMPHIYSSFNKLFILSSWVFSPLYMGIQLGHKCWDIVDVKLYMGLATAPSRTPGLSLLLLAFSLRWEGGDCGPRIWLCYAEEFRVGIPAKAKAGLPEAHLCENGAWLIFRPDPGCYGRARSELHLKPGFVSLI